MLEFSAAWEAKSEAMESLWLMNSALFIIISIIEFQLEHA